MTSRDPSAQSASIPFSEQVGLVVRAYRRKRGWSQRRLAETVGVPKSTVARLERSALGCSLDTVIGLLAETGHTLGVVDAHGALVTDWCATDLEARDRGGRRFPAHREVRRAVGARPFWWWLHEGVGTGPYGPEPRWTAEGFVKPPGVRFGRKPRPREPGEGLRWPY